MQPLERKPAIVGLRLVVADLDRRHYHRDHDKRSRGCKEE